MVINSPTHAVSHNPLGPRLAQVLLHRHRGLSMSKEHSQVNIPDGSDGVHIKSLSQTFLEHVVHVLHSL